jgi:competence protein ComEC
LARKYPAILALGAVISGIVLADIFEITSWVLLFAALSLALLACILYFARRPSMAGVFALLCLTAFSAFEYTYRFRTYPPGHIVHFIDDDRRYTVFGTVSDWPVIKNQRTSLIISVDSVSSEGRIRRGLGKLLLNLQTETTAIQYGDRIRFEAKLHSIKGGKNTSGFDYRRYLNMKGVFAAAYLPHHYSLQIDPVGPAHFYRVVERVRAYIVKTFKRTLGPEAAALASGFLIGDTRDISHEVYGFFRDSGTLHLLAVSGSNVGLVVVLFSFLLRASPLKSVGRNILLLAIIGFFSFLAYNQPSVVRAAVMASLVLIGRTLQRKVELNNIIASAALIILIVRPTELYDVGFQLSFVTAWGLIFFVPRASRIFQRIKTRWHYKLLVFPLMVCVVAQVVSLPLCAYYFQRLPLIAFLSNLVIVPLVSIIVLGELVLLLVYLLLPPVGVFFGSFLNPLLSATIFLLGFFGSGELNVLLTHRIAGFPLLLYYIFLILLSYSVYSSRTRRFAVLYLLLIGNCFAVYALLLGQPLPRVTIFSVPGGLISVNQLGRSQVVLSDLPQREYILSERIVKPFLISRNIVNPDVIALSADYRTLKESSYFLNRDGLSRLYLPSASRNTFRDICEVDSMVGVERTVYYGDSPIPDVRSDIDLWLSQGILLCRLDSSAIVFAGSQDKSALLSRVAEVCPADLILVKPTVLKRDIELLCSRPQSPFQLVVCNRLSRPARILLAAENPLSERCPPILETSQTGPVELVAKKGRFLRSD